MRRSISRGNSAENCGADEKSGRGMYRRRGREGG